MSLCSSSGRTALTTPFHIFFASNAVCVHGNEVYLILNIAAVSKKKNAGAVTQAMVLFRWQCRVGSKSPSNNKKIMLLNQLPHP
jgi:hypothetical protein